MKKDTKYCPKCGLIIEKDQTSCPNCNKELIKECPYCKKEIDSDASICPYCRKTQSKTTKKSNNAAIITISIIVIIFVVVGFSNNLNSFTNELDNNLNNNTNNNQTIIKSEEEIKNETIEKYKTECQNYDYKTIFRYAEDYKGKYAKFTGEIIQVQSAGSYYNLRVNVTKKEYGYYTDTIFVKYRPFKDATRVLEDDIVTVYGVLDGLYTYTSILNSEVTLPSINSRYIELENK